jgi:hypothetical protein
MGIKRQPYADFAELERRRAENLVGDQNCVAERGLDRRTYADDRSHGCRYP